jgi:hypothetical protein
MVNITCFLQLYAVSGKQKGGFPLAGHNLSCSIVEFPMVTMEMGAKMTIEWILFDTTDPHPFYNFHC